jgi:hypothetical protein
MAVLYQNCLSLSVLRIQEIAFPFTKVLLEVEVKLHRMTETYMLDIACVCVAWAVSGLLHAL